MNINELKKRIADAGCVGAGGAGFPTAVKVAEGADSLIINAAECEPLLYTDYYVMKRAMERIASGAETVMEAAGDPQWVPGRQGPHRQAPGAQPRGRGVLPREGTYSPRRLSHGG